MVGRLLSSLFCAGLVVACSACSSSDSGSVSDSTTERAQAGFDDITRDAGYSIDFSLTRRQDGKDDQTLSCLSVQADPFHADSTHFDIINWGASTVLDAQGGCQGGGDGARTVSVEGNYALTVSGPAPAAHPTCTATYRRNTISTRARAQLRSFASSQAPRTDVLLELARRSSGDGTSTVVLDLDPKKTAAAAGSTASTTPDSETMTITFAGATSHVIEAVEVDSAEDDQHAIFRYKYYKITKQQGGVGIPKECVTGSVGSITDLDQLKSALGF